MFHYRLVPENNRSRMLIAVFMAVMLHVGLMNFEFGPEKVSVPRISLPRSVSVFLGQKHIDDIQAQQKTDSQTAKPVIGDETAETEPKIDVIPESSGVLEKKDNIVEQPVLSKQTVELAVKIVEEKIKPAAESMPLDQEVENITIDAHAETIPENIIKDGPQTVQEKREAPLPGTLQTAYPRYNENTPPAYPNLARKRGQEGTVILQVLVNSEGRVDDLRIDVSSNFRLLDRAAVKSVRQWNFEPGRQNDKKIPMWVKVPITFKLKN